MSGFLPTVTIVIPARPEQSQILAAQAIQALDYPKEQLEIILARGKQPAVQRNAALRAAKGELVYFLDDDSRPQPDNLRRAAPHFEDPAVQILGGPNLCPPEAPALEQVFAVVLSSWLAFGPSRARYAPAGQLRETSEKELILCNMLARRQALLDLGGFDESLYPNEENALMDELQKRGGKLLYDPQFTIYRRPRPSLKTFCKMLLTYGRGRAEQFRLHPGLGSALNFAPPLFCLYLCIGPWFGRLGLIPLIPYALAVFAQTLVSVRAHGPMKSLAALPLVVLSHILYGLGFWRGLFTKLGAPKNKAPAEVSLETINLK